MGERFRGYAHRVDIAANVQAVWRALTEQDNLAQWCSPHARIRPQRGGLFRASVDRVTELEAHIDVFEPARRMRLIYLPSSELPESDTAIVDDFILEGNEAQTIVRLLGSGFPDDEEWDAQYRRLRTGWERAMARLKVFAEKLSREAS